MPFSILSLQLVHSQHLSQELLLATETQAEGSVASRLAANSELLGRLALSLHWHFLTCSLWVAPVWSLTRSILARGSVMFWSQSLAGPGWNRYLPCEQSPGV